jgi:glycosyltransferase involved in cell wall biosynthesis
VEYLGELGHDDKVALLGGATATLFPIDWEEPFGLVVVESLACGTPVLATRRGAAPELLEHGRTGLLAEHPDGLARAFDRVTEIEPADCRAAVEARFTATRMVDDYVSAYESLLAPPQPSRGPRRWRRPRPALAGELGPIRGSLVRGR